MKEFKTSFFGSEIIGRIPAGQDSIVPISIVDPKTSDAWTRVFSYDKSVGILESDTSKLGEIVDIFQNRGFNGSKFAISLINIFITVIGAIEKLIKSFLGMFFGFGIIGIFIVIGLAVASLMVSIYVFVVLAPLALIAYLFKWNLNRKAKKEVALLHQAIMEQFQC